jgi:hypothetical protein
MNADRTASGRLKGGCGYDWPPHVMVTQVTAGT